MSLQSLLRAVLCVLLLCGVAGCNPSGRVSVSGRAVRTDGKPVVGARVIVRSPSTGDYGSGLTDAEGRFDLGGTRKGDGLPPGDYGVAVSEDLGSWESPRSRSIHAKYASPKTSDLTLEVRQAMTWDLTLDPPTEIKKQ